MFDLNKFKDLVNTANNVVIIGHINPDGDALGSMVAVGELFTSLQKNITLVVPNEIPRYIDFIRSGASVVIARHNIEQCKHTISVADLIICVDFNDPATRIGALGEMVLASAAKKMMIDHHEQPVTQGFDLVISDPSYPSTTNLVYTVLNDSQLLDKLTIAGYQALYAGMITDTGNFTYSKITPSLMRAAADLIERGVEPVKLYNMLHNNQTENRMRLMAYLIGQKMVVLKDKGAAYITFTLAEQNRFGYSTGDSEGIVNMPMAIEGIDLSAIFIETTECIKISLRSLEGGINVNVMARENYTGGGHINAAGAKSFTSMNEAVAIFKRALGKVKKR